MEKLLLLSALFVTLLIELCSAAGAFAQQPNGLRQKQNRENLNTVQGQLGNLNENQYAANLETILQLLSERDAEEAVWRRNEEIERKNLMAELSAQKRSGFNYYGSRGKKSNGYEQQKRFNYFPSRG